MPGDRQIVSRWFHVTFVAWLLTLTGCGGCIKNPLKTRQLEDEERRQAELADKKKEEPPFVPFKTAVWPDTDRTGEDTDPRVFVKPGHWAQIAQLTRANKDDVTAELVTKCVDRRQSDIPLPRTPYRVSSSRPISLPKKQSRELNSTVFIPMLPGGGRDDSGMSSLRGVSVDARLRSPRGGRDLYRPPIQPLEPLRPYQYYVVVLAQYPDSYGYLSSRHTVRPPVEDWATSGLMTDYLLVRPNVVTRVPLPESSLAWSPIAYIVWDDVDPKVLSLAQQEALVDWLHWGGHLIVSGPSSFARLRGSFLEAYLPASDGNIVDVTEQQLQELNASWSIVPTRQNLDPVKHDLTPAAGRPLQMTELVLKEDAQFVPTTANLVAERRLGRGRIAMTAFRLDDVQIRSWPSFDGFLNGVLFRRPGRTFSPTAGSFGEGNGAVRWTDYPLMRRDARAYTSLRYFGRDATARWSRYARLDASRSTRDSAGDTQEDAIVQFEETRLAPGDTWNLNGDAAPYTGYRVDPIAGIGGWSDFCAVANEARYALQRAAGISVPDGRFVASVLGVYLIALVPVNWLIFRIMGRVEWAWFAAPLIAIVGAVGVIRSAHLDIGFVRSRTDLSVVELQTDYGRGHVTRFSGLYTSLSTSYTARLDDPSSLALPFSVDPPPDRLRQQSPRTVEYRRDQESEAALTGYSVISNSTGMFRAESMHEFAGTPALVGSSINDYQLHNGLPFPLRGVVVASRTKGKVYLSSVAEMDSSSKVKLQFHEAADNDAIIQDLESHPVTSSTVAEGEVNLRGFYRLALNAAGLQEGDVRLVAWSDQEVPGMTISPDPNQHTYRTVFVMNLRYGNWSLPQADANSAVDFVSMRGLD
ncbi:MAG: hypothetical protein KDA60_01055 [Planctomycetales bacterium]|nr:hypothetical protein [Planctomycetales bacterium]